MIGLKEIPIYVKDDMDAELDRKRVALIENCHRKDMVGSERAHGFFEVYKMAGYTKEQVIKGVKSIDNWFDHNRQIKDGWDYLRYKIIIPQNDIRANPLLYDKKFIEICKDIGFAPKYQYQLMQLVTQIQPEVLKYAEKAKPPIDHQILLTTRPLRDHPIIQKELIQEIANDLPRKAVPTRVKQVAKDLETGYLKLNDNGQYVKGDEKHREIVEGGDKVLEPIQVAHMDITTVDREPSKEFFNLVEAFAQSFEKPKEVYKKLVDRGREEEGFNDGEINMLINSYLKGRIAKSTLLYKQRLKKIFYLGKVKGYS